MTDAFGNRVVTACVELIGPPESYEPPSGYDSLALATLDAIWSIGVRYQAVSTVVEHYRGWVRTERAGDAEERTSRQLIEDIAQAGGPAAFATRVVRNEQRTSTRGGVLKAVAVLAASKTLLESGVLTAADLRERANDPDLKARWLAVKGQRSGISWRYVLMNVRVEDLKPDRMICRFVARALSRERVSPAEAHGAVLAAHSLLAERYSGLTLRALDHAIWGYERARSQ